MGLVLVRCYISFQAASLLSSICSLKLQAQHCRGKHAALRPFVGKTPWLLPA